MNMKSEGDGTQNWLVGEPSLDEILGDDMMSRVVASTGMSPAEFRSRLAEIARRLGAGQSGGAPESGQKPPRVALGS